MQNINRDNSINVLASEKVNTTVVLDHTEYNKKTEEIMQKDNNKILHKDPTTTNEGKV